MFDQKEDYNTIVPNLLESIQNSGEMYSLLGSNSMINVRYPFLISVVSLNPKLFVGIDKVIKENNNSACQNIYLISVKTFLSILKQANRFFFVKRNLVKDMIKKHCKFTVDEGFGNEFLRTSYVLLQEECENRPFSLYTSQMTDETKQEENLPSSRLVEEEENEKYFGPPTLSQPGYNLL